jgi:hypothetical protein
VEPVPGALSQLVAAHDIRACASCPPVGAVDSSSRADSFSSGASVAANQTVRRRRRRRSLRWRAGAGE